MLCNILEIGIQPNIYTDPGCGFVVVGYTPRRAVRRDPARQEDPGLCNHANIRQDPHGEPLMRAHDVLATFTSSE